MYTNLAKHGGNFKTILDKQFESADNITIASGYVSLDAMHVYENDFIRVAKHGGVSRLMLGMAFYEGLSQKKLDAACSLNEELQKHQELSGVYVANGRRYHGKIYHFANTDESNIYVGSSNFSSSGTTGNIECTVLVSSANEKTKLASFLEDLYSERYSVTIDNADILIPGKKQLVQTKIENIWNDLKRYDPTTINQSKLPQIRIPLKAIAEKEKSNFNVYFGKGRSRRNTKKITPRPWYEIEIIAHNDINSLPNYPKGDFTAFTDNGYIIPMCTQGDNNKNIRSRKNLQIFGIWLKGKLEKSGALNTYKPVTPGCLEEYGCTELVLYKIREGEYYMKF